MAQPQTAKDLGQHPVRAITEITVNSDGTVTPESSFVLGQGQIQFHSNYAQQISATFKPLGVFGDGSGTVQIYPNNLQNGAIQARQPYVTVDYMINLPGGATQGPYTVTVGCAPLQIDFDAAGKMLIPNARVPNGGIVTFLLAASAQQPLALTFNPTGPFGTGITLQPGQPQVLHADETDIGVIVSTPGAKQTQAGTVKVGSGGSPI